MKCAILIGGLILLWEDLRVMKSRIIRFLLVLCLILQVSGALAMTQEEWNAQCVNKTITETNVYAKAGDQQEASVLAAGVYVQTHAYDPVSGRWNIHYLEDGEVKEGFVSAVDLTIAVASVTLQDGSTETVPEAIEHDPENVASYLNMRYSDRHFSVENGTIVVSGNQEAADAQSDENNEEPSEEDDAQEAAETVADSTEEPVQTPAPIATPAVEAPTQEPTATPVPAPTALPADQFEVPEELKSVALIGTNRCLLQENGELKSVKTNSVHFGDTTKKNKMVAFARANADGYVQLLAEPQPRSRVIGYLKTGTLVGVIKAGSNYTRVFVDGVVGCVKNNMIGYVTVDKKPMNTGVLTAGGVIDPATTINVLSASSKSYLVDALPCGLKVDVWEKKGSYYEIEANGLRVWVHQTNLTLKASMDGMVEQTPWVHLLETPPLLTKTVTNNNGTQEVYDGSRTYNMHRDPYN